LPARDADEEEGDDDDDDGGGGGVIAAIQARPRIGVVLRVGATVKG
jgi:hypothetical protein